MNKKYFLIGIAACSFLGISDAAQAQITEKTSPIPGSTQTTSEVLFVLPQDDTEIAQRDIELGRLTPRHDYTYIGAGVNLGFNGDDASPIGDIGFLVNGKVALTRNLSLRPGVIFSGDTAFLVPLTYDFTLTKSDPFEPSPFVPYVGGGVVFTTDNDNEFGVLVNGGVDYRISKRIVANAGLNVGFMSDTTDVGLTLSIGYIISKP